MAGDDIFNLERDRGILTESDRKYLAGESDLSDQGQRDARYRIRNRLTDGLHDLVFLNERLSLEDREQVAEDVFSEGPLGLGALTSITDFLFRMLRDTTEDEERWIEVSETMISAAFTRAVEASNEGAMVSVDVRIDPDIREPDIDVLLEKYENMEETRREFEYLRREDAIEFDDTYSRHRFHHYWEDGEEVVWLLPDDTMVMIDPADYNSEDEFISTCMERREEVREQWAEEQEWDEDDT